MCFCIDWLLLEEYVKSICHVLPQNNLLNIDKLKAISHFLKDRGEQLSKLIPSSSSAGARGINEKIIAYLIVKLCYNDTDTASLCDAMGESVGPTDTCTPTGIQQINNGM